MTIDMVFEITEIPGKIGIIRTFFFLFYPGEGGERGYSPIMRYVCVPTIRVGSNHVGNYKDGLF